MTGNLKLSIYFVCSATRDKQDRMDDSISRNKSVESLSGEQRVYPVRSVILTDVASKGSAHLPENETPLVWANGQFVTCDQGTPVLLLGYSKMYHSWIWEILM